MFHDFTEKPIDGVNDDLKQALINFVSNYSLTYTEVCSLTDEFQQEYESGKLDVINELKKLLQTHGVI